MKRKFLASLFILLAFSSILPAQEKAKFEVGVGGLFLFNTREYGLLYPSRSGFMVNAGLYYRFIGIQGEVWFYEGSVSEHGVTYGPSLILSPFYKSKLSPFLLAGYLTSNEGGSWFILGLGLKFMAAKTVGLRAEVRLAEETEFGEPIGIFSGGIFFRF